MRFTCGYPFPVGGGEGGILCARFFGVGHYGEQGERWAVSWTNDTPRAEALNFGEGGHVRFYFILYIYIFFGGGGVQ